MELRHGRARPTGHLPPRGRALVSIWLFAAGCVIPTAPLAGTHCDATHPCQSGACVSGLCGASGAPGDGGADAGTGFDAGSDAGPLTDAGPTDAGGLADAGAACPAGEMPFGGACVCQTSGLACQPPANAVGFCDGGIACDYVCQGGLMKCLTGCCGAVSLESEGPGSCALLGDGELRCWGVVDLDGVMPSPASPPMADGGAPSNVRLVAIMGGDSAAGAICAWTSGGLFCEGEGHDGETATGDFQSHYGFVPAGLSADAGLVALAGGSSDACAVTTAGTVECWGSGVTWNGLSSSPTAITTSGTADGGLLAGIASVALGYHHVCALAFDGGVSCWGDNNNGELGQGTAWGGPNPGPLPVSLPVSAPVVVLAAGGSESCAILADGQVYCWGDGAPTTGASCASPCPGPAWLPLPFRPVALAVGASGFACALLDGGSVRCWGANGLGETGASPTGAAVPPSAASLALAGATAVAAGDDFACAITLDGGVVCWGGAENGQLGRSANLSADGGVGAPDFVYGG